MYTFRLAFVFSFPANAVENRKKLYVIVHCGDIADTSCFNRLPASVSD